METIIQTLLIFYLTWALLLIFPFAFYLYRAIVNKGRTSVSLAIIFGILFLPELIWYIFEVITQVSDPIVALYDLFPVWILLTVVGIALKERGDRAGYTKAAKTASIFITAGKTVIIFIGLLCLLAIFALLSLAGAIR